MKLNSINIRNYRGINDLYVEGLSKVNLIVGDNNCGKTTVLEAIQLLRMPIDINNVFRVARLRDNIISPSRISLYNSFISLCQGDYTKYLSIGGDIEYLNDGKIARDRCQLSIRGLTKKVMFDINDIPRLDRIRYTPRMLEPMEGEMDEFVGECMIESSLNGTSTSEFKVNRFTSVSGREIRDSRIVYLSPVAHTIKNVFSRVINNVKYKEECIKILKFFDANIEDLVLLKPDDSYNSVEYVRDSVNGLMPLSSYGDGIKKVLAIANAILSAKGGILLIDEVETSIHFKYYSKIFEFIIKSCDVYDVQLFITTHSIEAVDGLLSTNVVDNKYIDVVDNIRVITLKKEKDCAKTLARVMAGKEVYDSRENFDFEVRL